MPRSFAHAKCWGRQWQNTLILAEFSADLVALCSVIRVICFRTITIINIFSLQIKIDTLSFLKDISILSAKVHMVAKQPIV